MLSIVPCLILVYSRLDLRTKLVFHKCLELLVEIQNISSQIFRKKLFVRRKTSSKFAEENPKNPKIKKIGLSK